MEGSETPTKSAYQGLFMLNLGYGVESGREKAKGGGA